MKKVLVILGRVYFKTGKESVHQSRVYVNLDYIFRVYKFILIAYINAQKIRVKKMYVNLECMST